MIFYGEKPPTTLEQMVSLAQELCNLQEGMATATRSLCYMMAHELNKEPKAPIDKSKDTERKENTRIDKETEQQ